MPQTMCVVKILRGLSCVCIDKLSSATLAEWLPQPLSHSGKSGHSGPATQPLSHSGEVAGAATQHSVTRLAEWLSGWSSHSYQSG